MNISKNYLLEKFKKVLKNDEVSLDDSFLFEKNIKNSAKNSSCAIL